jgi:hypothetical protein
MPDMEEEAYKVYEVVECMPTDIRVEDLWNNTKKQKAE